MEVLRKYKSAFERQNNEPTRIKIAKPGTNINSKTEWNNQNIQRLQSINIGREHQTNINYTQINSSNNTNESSNSNNDIIIRKAGRPKGSRNKKTLNRIQASNERENTSISNSEQP